MNSYTAAEEQKAFQIQHGEKYIQLKSYTDQLEAELRETKSKMQTLTNSNDELREVSSHSTRSCHAIALKCSLYDYRHTRKSQENAGTGKKWTRDSIYIYQCKTLKAQPGARQFPSPTRSTMGMMHQEGGTLVSQASQFNRPAMRPMGRSYAVDTSSSSTRNPMTSMGGQETPRIIQRPNVGMFDRFSRPQIGALRFLAPFRTAHGGIKNSNHAPENSAATVAASRISLKKVHYSYSLSTVNRPANAMTTYILPHNRPTFRM
ncbi:hypothetical protein DD238_001229 [Peronospora effusa]|uniref:Uncharacterized protein n=1 Tax=Peronospora effusa TaxID=542832 RepID=A0A3M6VPA1_9STRA|nr:hypothetical protein DD238_001229 [Peronospora effusa]RQM17200.1 hypothetical protein DD237_001857 [Peronospora effusa]